MENSFFHSARRQYGILILIGLAAFIASSWIAVRVLEKFPNSADEFAYLFQAETYCEGRLSNPAHPLNLFFKPIHIFHESGKYFSKYPPAWPALLSLGMLLKIPTWLINPIIGTLSLIFVYGIARQRYNGQVALISVLTVFASPFFLFNSASYLSHPACAFFILGFCWFALRYERNENAWEGLAAGMMLGLAFQTRYFTAALAGGAFLIYFLDKYPKKLSKALLLIGWGFLPWMIVFFLYNFAITGNVLLTPFQMYDAYDRVGFFQNGPYPHSWIKAVMKMNAKWNYLAHWTGYVFGYLYLFALLRFLKKRTWHFTDLVLLFLMAGYGFHWATGTNQYGPRYYYEGFALAVIAITGMIFGERRISSQSEAKRVFQMILAAVFFTGVILAIAKIPERVMTVYENIQSRQDLYRQVDVLGIQHAVVLIQDVGVKEGRQRRDPTGLIRDFTRKDLIRNDPRFENDVLYALDRGSENSQLMRYYPTREFYVYRRGKDAIMGSLSKMKSAHE